MDKLKAVAEKIREFDALYKRMDNTASQLQDKYELKNFENQPIRKSISVTSNVPKWQANVLANKLIKLQWQTKVESSNKLSKTLISRIEQFSDDVWAQVDEFLSEKDGFSGGLDSWNAKKAVNRGPIGARWWPYYDKNGKLIIDCLPLDMRWVPFEYKEWYCIRSWRNAAQIKRDYPQGNGVTDLTGYDIELLDFWDNEKEEIFILGAGTTFTSTSTGSSSIPSGISIFTMLNSYKVPPFVVVMTSTGFQFRDKGYLEHESESYDWLDRFLYEEDSRLASIAQSLALDSLIPGAEQSKKDINTAVDPLPLPDEVQAVREGEKHEIIKRGDITNAFLKANAQITQWINRGGVTDTESGDVPGSDTAILTTVRNTLLAEKLQPFKDALATFKQKSIRMIIDQYIKLDKIKSREVGLGMSGMTHRYSATQLGDPSTYHITYIPMLNSKDQNIANVAIANAQKGLLPLRFILEDTLQVQDPDSILRELEMEKAKALDPSIGLIEMALSYAAEAEDLEGIEADIANMKSMMLTDEAVVILRQRDAAANPQLPTPTALSTPTPNPQEVPKPNQQGLLALGGAMPKVAVGGNGGSSAVKTEVVAK